MADALAGLIARLEAATGHDRRIDALIWQLTEPCEPPDCIPAMRDEIVARFLAGKQWGDREVPAYTASLDAALSLVPEGLYWLVGAGRTRPSEPLYGARVSKPGSDEEVSIAEHDATPALALCIASLKARAAQAR